MNSVHQDVGTKCVRKGSLIQVTTEWMRPNAWVNQSGIAQASIDLDGNRLVLLERVNDRDNDIIEDIDF